MRYVRSVGLLRSYYKCARFISIILNVAPVLHTVWVKVPAKMQRWRRWRRPGEANVKMKIVRKTENGRHTERNLLLTQNLREPLRNKYVVNKATVDSRSPCLFSTNIYISFGDNKWIKRNAESFCMDCMVKENKQRRHGNLFCNESQRAETRCGNNAFETICEEEICISDLCTFHAAIRLQSKSNYVRRWARICSIEIDWNRCQRCFLFFFFLPTDLVGECVMVWDRDLFSKGKVDQVSCDGNKIAWAALFCCCCCGSVFPQRNKWYRWSPSSVRTPSIGFVLLDDAHKFSYISPSLFSSDEASWFSSNSMLYIWQTCAWDEFRCSVFFVGHRSTCVCVCFAAWTWHTWCGYIMGGFVCAKTKL